MRVLGIDPSTVSTGVVVLEGTLKQPPTVLYEHSYKPKSEGMERVSSILGHILLVLDIYKPDAIALEDYGLNLKHKTSIVPLVTLGSIIRYYFQQEQIHYLCPSPSEHKRFVTGNGNTKKELVPGFILSTWGHDPLDGDTADAYGLACMVLAHRNALAGVTLTMREVVANLKLF